MHDEQRMAPARQASATAALALLLLAAGCEPDPRGLSWGVRFSSDGDRDRAVLVRAQILRGGCTGDEIYATDLDPSRPGAMLASPPELEPGAYGFAGRARDADCVWFAQGCSDAVLPLANDATIFVNLLGGFDDRACPEEECVDGRCTGETVDAGTDAGPSPADGGPDAGPRDGGPDTGCGGEVCNGADDDCDDNVDEGTGSELCSGDAFATCSSGTCGCGSGLEWDDMRRRCRDTASDPRWCGSSHQDCDDDEYCSGGTCVCRPGLDRVGSSCVDFDTDPMHCGGVGIDCSTMGTMVTCRGSCEDACTTGQTNCSNACVDLQTDPFHCGACAGEDTRCESDRICISGDCRRYEPARGGCGDCTGDETCCTYGGNQVCVDDDTCP